MKIQIISGTYGLRVNGYTVIRKTPDDPPFDVSDDEAARLVKLRVARIVGNPPVETPVEEPVQPDPVEEPVQPDPEKDEDGEITETPPAYSESMKLAELKEVAAAYGVDASKAKSKAEVIALIEAAKATDQDNEQPPEISAALPE